MTKIFPKIHDAVTQNCAAFLTEPMITPTGFREYDARWQFPDQINLVGIQALGLGLGTQLHEMGLGESGAPVIAVGNDYREYSLAVKQALIMGLLAAGCEVHDIGLALSPVAYFAQFELDAPAVAMVTASHNPNGWTGVKIGAERPLTHGPKEMARLRDIVLGGDAETRDGGRYIRVENLREKYLDDLTRGFKMSRPLKVVAACGNGTAGAFAVEALERIGVEVIPMHTELDYPFPHHNPNPEALEMLHAMSDAVKEHGADIAVGFDGDGDRCGIVDDEAEEIFADKVGVIMARDWAKLHPNAQFVADVKSTGLFSSDPELQALNAKTDYWITGHSHMKRRVKEINALAGFEKSGHYFLAEPIGRGYDDGLRVAIEICKLLDRNPDKSMSDLRKALPTTFGSPTMSPHCADTEKYDVIERVQARLVELKESGSLFANLPIDDVITVNGARVQLEGGGWALVRASSNTPNLVVVVESPNSAKERDSLFEYLNTILSDFPEIGAYDQTL